jgi:hypothetical protein
MTKGQKIALIVAGFVALAGGIGYVLFRHSKKDELPMDGIPPYRDGDYSGGNTGGGTTPTETVTPTKPTASDILDEKIQRGSKGEGAKAIQVIINQIAQWRGWNGTTRKAPNGVNVKFPLDQDGNFGAQSDGAARLIFSSYPVNGNITRHNARLKWAYAQGFYKKQLDQNLKNSTRKAEYEREWNNGSKASK